MPFLDISALGNLQSLCLRWERPAGPHASQVKQDETSRVCAAAHEVWESESSEGSQGMTILGGTGGYEFSSLGEEMGRGVSSLHGRASTSDSAAS